MLVYDTSRLARRRYIAQALKHEAKKRGISILYARVPTDIDPVSEIILQSVLEAMDEVHSLMSRTKGLAGMSENVRRGWRAGGRAPFGYRLETHTTGAIRENKPVTKSKLVPNEHALAIRAYLKARALGVPRVQAIADAGIKKSQTTMIGIEWNALTYAGHTVWNRHAEQGSGTKQRARDQWQVTRNTHEPLITDAEAEAILAKLETSDVSRAISLAKASRSPCLLTGLLFTEDGQQWVGHGKYYRLRKMGAQRGKLVPAADIDAAVIAQVQADFRSDLFLRNLLEASRKHREISDPSVAIETRIRQLEREKAKAAELALTSDAGTFLALVNERTRQIDALRREMDAVRAENSLATHVASLTPEKLRDILSDQEPKKAMETLVERIILEPDLTCRIHYRALPGRSQWRSMASPRGFDRWPRELTATLLLKGAA